MGSKPDDTHKTPEEWAELAALEVVGSHWSAHLLDHADDPRCLTCRTRHKLVAIFHAAMAQARADAINTKPQRDPRGDTN